MWYFAWILGIGLALAFGIINVMWLESNYAFGSRDEETTRKRFEDAADEEENRPRKK
ncbi:cytochrome bd-I oxidase subunit CydX [Glaciimonas sp. PCH181]|uniref:cytochrome bd-I oxidase subunit CydX n=1 Tax=Glaciimonas sp. PCH181 TaxID=2133943 RepID=UPI000D3352F0|nr:cytochrome bd-I oxidase subunit CydX [Glaciimonas sp. PCH181]PUA18655.1 cytochrome bd-I oxidase subunit CydX [Glaciimonas sp. PCH181]